MCKLTIEDTLIPQQRRIWHVGMGSRGDTQPYVALYVGLQKAGHDVTAYDIVTEKVERAAKTGAVTPLGEHG